MKKIINLIYDAAFFLIVLMTTALIVTGISLLVKMTIGYWQLPVSLVIALIIVFFINKKNWKRLLSTVIISVVVCGSALFACNNYYDSYWDSNGYHKDAIGALKNGWNPIYEDYISFYKNSGYRDMKIIGNKIEKSKGLWQTHYTKGLWYLSANVYKYTNDVESAKIFNILLTFISFGLILAATFKLTKKVLLSFVIGLLFSITPVNIVQLFSYYNDGALYNSLLILVSSLILFIINKENKYNKEIYIWLASSIIIISNIKFTGLAYGGIMCLPLYIYYVLKKYKEEKIKDVIKPTLVFVSSVLVAVTVVGFQPYITNTIDKANPLYPLMGKDKVDIVSYNEPKEFHEMSTPKKFIKSIFGKTMNINEKSKLPVEEKLPLTVYSEELLELQKSDVRIGGFGVYFSGILIISAVIIIYGLYKSFKQNKNLFCIVSAILISIVFLTLFISESWWARYTPFIYFIPLIAITFGVIYINKANKAVLIVLSTLLVLNLNFYFQHNIIRNYQESKEIKRILDEYEEEDKEMVLVDYSDQLFGYLYNLEDRKIEHKFSTKTSKEDKRLFRYMKYREVK